MAVLRRKEDGMGFSGKKPACLYGSEKEKDVLKELHRFLEETLTEPEVLKKKRISAFWGPAVSAAASDGKFKRTESAASGASYWNH